MARVERFHAKHQKMGAASLDDDGAARANFRQGALDSDLPRPAVRLKNVLDFSHTTPD